MILLTGTLYISAAGDHIGAYSCILENNEYTGPGEITSFDVDENGKILVNIRAFKTEFEEIYYIQLYDSNFNYLNSIRYKAFQYTTACFSSDGNIEIWGYRTKYVYVYNLSGDFLYKQKEEGPNNAASKSFRQLETAEGCYTRNPIKDTLLFTDVEGTETVIVKLHNAFFSSMLRYLFKEILTCVIIFGIVAVVVRKQRRKKSS